jgi:hypothetical protein
VGGQYNFVAMAHALEGGRSILLVRSTRGAGRKLQSNVVAAYASTTIPRHLRDLVITEYGIAELRGRTNEQVAMALIEVADARFQARLLSDGRRAGAVAPNYRLPEAARHNTLEVLEGVLAPYRSQGLFPAFPFGTDFTPDEIVLIKALQYLKSVAERERFPRLAPVSLSRAVQVPDAARQYLARLQLEHPRGMRERIMQRAVVYALGAVDAI